jgi:multiple sugar transport system ATP-binding protein
VAPPLDLYRTPANRFVAEFIGSPPMNFMPVQVQAPYLVTHPHFRLSLPSSWHEPAGALRWPFPAIGDSP